MTQKRLIQIGGILLVGLTVLYFVRKSKKDESNSNNNNNNGGNGDNPQPPSPDPNQPSALPFKAMADELFNAMNGYGTTENKIYEILGRLKKKPDWNALVSAYGTRKLSSGAGNVFVSDFNGNLPDSFKSELSSSEMKAVNQILSKIGVSI